MLRIEKLNECDLKIYTNEQSIIHEIRDKYTFYAKDYKFHPKFKNKQWDGKIRLFNSLTKIMPLGLLSNLLHFLKVNQYEYELVGFEGKKLVTEREVIDFIKTLNLPEKLEYRDYQIEAIVAALNDHRGVYISPTASGKSYIIYVVWRYLRDVIGVEKSLIVVPTISLVSQMFYDFKDYGFDSERFIHRIYGGEDKRSSKELTISTWQSIYKLEENWFNFDVCIGDEAHTFNANSLKMIMSNLKKCEWKFGFTGTLDGSVVNELTLEGLFGPIRKITSTNELMKQGHIAQFKIKAIILKHSKEVCDYFNNNKIEYVKEIDYILKNQSRNKFITELVSRLKGNTIVFFKIIDHGQELYRMITDAVKDRKVFYIDGSVSATEREEIRRSIEEGKDVIFIASIGTTSTGVNILSLENLIFTSPSKSRIKVLQSIGRSLRKHKDKKIATLYDIGDNISTKKKHNHSYRHFIERLKMYIDEKFDYKIYEKNL